MYFDNMHFIEHRVAISILDLTANQIVGNISNCIFKWEPNFLVENVFVYLAHNRLTGMDEGIDRQSDLYNIGYIL